MCCFKTALRRYFTFILLLLPFSIIHAEAPPNEAEQEWKPNILVLYGPPGSGRTKIAVKLNQHFDIPKVSFAELLADALHEDSQIGDRSREYMNVGGNIPIDLFWMILERRMKMKDCSLGCLWEGIPWTVEQARMAKEKLSKSFQFIVFSIDASDQWLIQRVEGRLFCSRCGRVYNDPHSIPKIDGICDICGHQLKRRIEDSPESVLARYQTYQTSMSPVLDFWNKQHLLKVISGDKNLDDIYNDIIRITEASFHEDADLENLQDSHEK